MFNEASAAHVLVRINKLSAHYSALNGLLINVHDYRVLMMMMFKAFNGFALVNLPNLTNKYGHMEMHFIRNCVQLHTALSE